MGLSQTDREELLRAGDELKRQIATVANPIRGSDANPQLVARLQAMLDEIADLLAEDVTNASAQDAPACSTPTSS